MDWVNKHLQIVPINTFIDPIFPVENAIITHAHADHAKPGHKNVLATKHTIKIMKIRYGENCANNFQELSFNSPFFFSYFEISSISLLTISSNDTCLLSIPSHSGLLFNVLEFLPII